MSPEVGNTHGRFCEWFPKSRDWAGVLEALTTVAVNDTTYPSLSGTAEPDIGLLLVAMPARICVPPKSCIVVG